MIGNGSSIDNRVQYFTAFKANFAFGIQTAYRITNSFTLSGGIIYNIVINDLYKTDGTGDTVVLSFGNDSIIHNVRSEFGITFSY
jgi:hypothetical protein